MLSWPTDPRLVEAICRLLDNPDVRDSVAEILGGLNLYPKVQAKLLSYLDSHPDALVSGRSDGPASRLRLLKALAETHPGLVVPAKCSGCGRQVVLNRWGANGDRVCGTCYLANRLVPCGRCGRIRPVGGRHSTDGLVCTACIRHDPARRQECSLCGRVNPVAARTPGGEPLCQTCRPRESFVCLSCGRTHTVKSLNVAGAALCWACYKRHHKQACSDCGREHAQVPRRGPRGSDYATDAGTRDRSLAGTVARARRPKSGGSMAGISVTPATSSVARNDPAGRAVVPRPCGPSFPSDLCAAPATNRSAPSLTLAFSAARVDPWSGSPAVIAGSAVHARANDARGPATPAVSSLLPTLVDDVRGAPLRKN